jgi:molybdopterin molybdotransferase
MKPGKPLLLARRGEQWILGLPGNPVSSYVTAFLFLLPLLRRLAGPTTACPALIRSAAARCRRRTAARVRPRATRPADVVTPLDEQDSARCGPWPRPTP